ncbi:MAG: hypothetical protein H7647_02075 [Candidatus Heimdallarchaeota archaeon]|nr:hypothetical protein [Candidatus Heimdallarchaeota archaeon]
MPKKTAEEKLTLCPKCLRKAKMKNASMSSFLLLMVIGFIVLTILLARSG